MPEWSNGAVSKTVVRSRVPRVRIPLSPPFCSRPQVFWGFFSPKIRVSPNWYRILVQGRGILAPNRPPFLVQRGGVYYFRRALPLNLQSRFGRAEIKVSLLTKDSCTAEMRSRELTNRFVQLTSLVKRMPELSPEVINRIVRDAFTRGLENIREVARDVSEDAHVDSAHELSETKEAYAALQQRLATRNYEKVIEVEAREFLDEVNIAPPAKASDEWDALCHGLTRARAEGFRIYMAMLEGRYEDIEPKDPMFKGPVNSVLGQAALAAGPSVAELAEQFIELKSKAEWKKKTQLDNIRVLNWFREMAGEKRSITSISKADVQDFRDLLMALPKNYAKAKKYEGLALKQIVEVGVDEDKLSLRTADKYLSMLKGFLHWCRDEEHIPAAPGEKVKVPLKANPQEARYPFSSDQLVKLFASPQFTGHYSVGRRNKPGDVIVRDGKFWIPLIGLFTGMRLGEIVQLRTNDVRQDDGNWYFDVTINEDEDKTLKTVHSKRRIPLHSELIKIGFLGYRAQRAEKAEQSPRLFPDIKPGKDGYMSHNFSKWFSRYTKAVAVKTDKTTFHSFRHNFKDALHAAGIDGTVQNALMGHTDTSAAAGYGSGIPVSNLVQAMDKLSSPVDLKHLHTE